MKDIAFLEGILAAVTSQDTQRRLKAAEDFSNYLSVPSNGIEFIGFDKLLDGLVGWVNSSNFKISLTGLDLLHQIVDRLGANFRSHLLPVVPAVVERLGDSKQQVRDSAQELLQKFMYPVSTPQHVLEQLISAFGHKAWRVREEVLHCLITTLNAFGPSSLTVSKFVPHICKLLGDPNSQVRDSAINSLVEIYRHVGEKVRVDLSKKGIPSSRLSIIYAKFDEVARSGNMVVNEPNGSSRVNGEVETDGAKLSTPVPSRTASVKKGGPQRKTSGSKTSGPSSNSASAGAVDEADFENAFLDCPDIKVYSSKDLTEEMAKIQSVLSDDKNDWEHRVAALKKIRSLINGGALEYDNFVSLVRLQEGAFKLSTKDLRSSVTREACVTLSYLSTVLKNQFDHTAEAVLPTLINLITNSAKIMATSGHACISFILKNTHSHRLIPVITNNMTSKSSIIRRRCCGYVDLFLTHWETSTIKSRVSEIEEAIRKGISDADPEARAGMRRAFWHYHEHFRDRAESLLKSFDASKQKQLENDRNLSNLGPVKSSSSGRFVSVKPSKPISGNRVRSSSAASEDGTTSSRHTAPSRQTVGASSRAARTTHREDSRHAVASKGTGSLLSPMAALGRSLSNIDQRSAERASARSKIRAVPRTSPQSHHMQQRQIRPQYPSRGTVSQPGSRSQSPERLLSTFPPRERSEVYCRRESISRTKIPTPSVSRHGSNENLAGIDSHSPQSHPSSSPSFLPVRKTPRARTASQCSSRASSRASSRGASRDTSPDRRGDRRMSTERGYSPSHLPVMKKTSPLHNPPMVKQSSQGEPTSKGVTEEAVWNAWHKSPSRRKYSFGSQCSDDDDSDVASISSERSYGSRGSRNHPKHLEPGNEVAEIVRLTSSNEWSDRRDGVICLQGFLLNSGVLSQIELGRIKDCLTRLFFDPHNKVYSLFLDALCDFIVVNKVDLHDWLFVLLSRLLTKLGTDLLSSLQSKVVRVLDVIRDSFPYDLQFSILTRFITDQTQTPNLKVKIAILQYLQGLIGLMDPSDFTNSGETRLAVSRIITWTTEPKSADVRKESAAVIVVLFELNTPEFSMMLTVLPKSFQDGATKLLHNHLKSSTQSNEPFAAGRGSPSSAGSNFDDVENERPRLRLGYRTLSSSSMKGVSPGKDENLSSPEHHTKIPTPTKTAQSPRGGQTRFGLSPRTNGNSVKRDNSFEAEAISSSESLDGRFASPLPPHRGEGSSHPPEDAPSVSSGYHSDDVTSGNVENTAQTSATGPPSSSGSAGQKYDPRQYQDQQNDFHPVPEINGFITAGRKKNGEVEDELDRSIEGMEHSDDQFDKDVSLEHADALSPIMVPVGAPSGMQSEDKKEALGELLRMAREDTPVLWEENHNTLLSLLMKNMGDDEPAVRLLSLRVLRDMVRTKPQAFNKQINKMVETVLNAHKDAQKEVARVAEEAAGTIAKSLPPEVCLQALSPVLREAEFPVNLAALKMTIKVVEDIDGETIEENLGEIVPGLVRCYDHVESSVRKASVFCLVAIHGVVGEETLMPHLAELSGTKMKLLNLYIKRAQAGNGGARP
ncbi:CLIP-associating protein 1-A-like isoform X4 [Stylophora pistillata]|uniref:CLIP-associating protein 1-A-like isoform X4 n=1 Tax=Stylophora pistillata TaxID=50429 RepID=UPI000C03D56D|nr:CLIP-associating protein 1-A-like isoform X4 [Stylophora pistillata]